jgi:putative ABC transport system ATP-binding protein
VASRSLIRLESVSRYYAGDRIKAVDSVDLKIKPGEWVTVTGPSGSGKSTLLNLMCGVDQPNGGRIYFNDSEVNTNGSWTRIRRRFIGFVFQSFNLLPTLTALENVQIPMFGNGRNPKQRRKRARMLLERVGLAEAWQRRPGDLSGGERQRVAIARALANEPLLILADEPTGNLDSDNSLQILNLLKDIHHRESTTVVLVTHDPGMAKNGEQRVRLIDGRVA